jgi:23S rRNA (cytidine1920-2'-O)/16S rRNA (cytidine1409-2'-O)-methyltransferase
MQNQKLKKERADILLFNSGLCESRERAKTLIMAGKVRIGNDFVVKKPSEKFLTNTIFTIKEPIPFVSRGAYKLLPALDKYLPKLNNLTAIDIGASTGGFTDLMLQRGLKKAYTIDSGRGQLHSKIRNNPRVVCYEKTNARYITPEIIDEPADIMVMDVSFISVTKLLIPCSALLKNNAWAFILIKPQFEAERSEVAHGGVVRDKDIHEKVINKVVNFAKENINFKLIEVIPSPITGPKGNQEYIAIFRLNNK